MIGTILGHYRIVEQTGRHSATSRARSLGYARDKLREAERSLSQSGWFQ